MLIEVIGMPWGSMPCGGFQEAKNRPCLGYQPETEGAKPRTPLFKISNNLLILGEELSEVREIEKPGNLGQTGFPRVLVITNEEKMMKSALWGAFYSFAILDPSCTMTMPMKQVISGAFDSLSHSMETYMGSPGEVNLSDEINEATQRNIIRNIRATLKDPQDVRARSELIWAAAMAENGILKIGKATDFQCHMLEHQLGAYTDCNHGQGLAVLHPVLYRHMMPEANRQFARMATEVWGISADGKSEAELAEAFVDTLEAFIKEIGLPTTFSEMGIPEETDYKAIADSTVLTGGCAKKFTKTELLEILLECR